MPQHDFAFVPFVQHGQTLNCIAALGRCPRILLWQDVRDRALDLLFLGQRQQVICLIVTLLNFIMNSWSIWIHLDPSGSSLIWRLETLGSDKRSKLRVKVLEANGREGTKSLNIPCPRIHRHDGTFIQALYKRHKRTWSNFYVSKRLWIHVRLASMASMASMAGLPLPREQGPGLPARGRKSCHSCHSCHSGMAKVWCSFERSLGLWGQVLDRHWRHGRWMKLLASKADEPDDVSCFTDLLFAKLLISDIVF